MVYYETKWSNKVVFTIETTDDQTTFECDTVVAGLNQLGSQGWKFIEGNLGINRWLFMRNK